MKKLLFILSLASASVVCAGNVNQKSNFTTYKNVSPKDVVSKYEGNKVVFYRNDSCFFANINEDGELQNVTYTKEFKKLGLEGQIAYEKTGKMYYSKSGKLFFSEKKPNGKWSYGNPVIIKGSEVTRDKYRGSVLAYGNWRYMPKDSIVILNPSISDDGNTLYFASNLGNSDGLDIWYVEKTEDGEWSYPHKMGRDINSNADEDFPFIREDGKMTFASNRRTANSQPDSAKYDVYFYNPERGGRPVLLANVLDDELQEPELAVNDKLKEPALTDSAALANNKQNADSLLAANTNGNSDGSNGNNINGVNGTIGNNVANPTLLPTGGVNVNNGSITENDVIIGIDDTKKTENDKILALLADTSKNNGKDNLANKKVAVKTLEEALQENPDSVIRASKNVIATTDKRIFYFDYDKDILNGDYAKDIEVLLDFIHFYPKSSFLIVGHTDERGTFEYNDALSIKRAKKIQSILINKGISKSRLYIMGLGEYKPVIKNAEKEAEHQKNRRVEIQRMD
ncbi:MAG: OmpA family protein [Paludibacteraceae bacterium]|nr:OmpA family protein [Paludibacteraceae bacterium]